MRFDSPKRRAVHPIRAGLLAGEPTASATVARIEAAIRKHAGAQKLHVLVMRELDFTSTSTFYSALNLAGLAGLLHKCGFEHRLADAVKAHGVASPEARRAVATYVRLSVARLDAMIESRRFSDIFGQQP